MSPMIFDAKGRLRPVTVTGLRSSPPPRPAAKGAPACWNVTSSETSIPLAGSLYRWQWTARLAYSGPAGRLSVRFGPGQSATVVLPPGTHVVYVPLVGSGNVISARFAAAGARPAFGVIGSFGSFGAFGARPLCVAAVAVGLVYPDQAARAIPAAPVPG